MSFAAVSIFYLNPAVPISFSRSSLVVLHFCDLWVSIVILVCRCCHHFSSVSVQASYISFLSGHEHIPGRSLSSVLCLSWQVLLVMTPFRMVLCRNLQFTVAELGLVLCHNVVEHLDPCLPSCSSAFNFHFQNCS